MSLRTTIESSAKTTTPTQHAAAEVVELGGFTGFTRGTGRTEMAFGRGVEPAASAIPVRSEAVWRTVLRVLGHAYAALEMAGVNEAVCCESRGVNEWRGETGHRRNFCF